MRSLYFIFLFCGAQSLHFAALPDSGSYFPHAVGNQWFYLYNDGSLQKLRIAGDSTDLAGYTYISMYWQITKANNEQTTSLWQYKINKNEDSLWGPTLLDKLALKFPLSEGEIFVTRHDTIHVLHQPPRYAPVENAKALEVKPVNWRGRLFPSVSIGYENIRDNDSNTVLGLYYEQIQYAQGLGIIWYGNEVEYKELIGCVINGDTLGYFVDVKNESAATPKSFCLEQNYPNPFNNATNISFQLTAACHATLKVYNITGKEVAVLINKELHAGSHTVNFNATDLPTGVYVYRLQAGNTTVVKKMILLK